MTLDKRYLLVIIFHEIFITYLSNNPTQNVVKSWGINIKIHTIYLKSEVKKKTFISKLTNLNLINNCLKVRRKCGIFNCCHKINMNKSATIFVCMNKISDDIIILTKLLMLLYSWRLKNENFCIFFIFQM